MLPYSTVIDSEFINLVLKFIKENGIKLFLSNSAELLDIVSSIVQIFESGIF